MNWRRIDNRHMLSDCGLYLILRARVPPRNGGAEYMALRYREGPAGSSEVVGREIVADASDTAARAALVDRLKLACAEHASHA